MSPALASGFSTTEPPGELPHLFFFFFQINFKILEQSLHLQKNREQNTGRSHAEPPGFPCR